MQNNQPKEGWEEGVIFRIFEKTEYEKVPTKGKYKIVNTGWFDGEKVWTGEHTPYIQVVQFDDSIGGDYCITGKVIEFKKEILNKLLTDGNLEITGSTRHQTEQRVARDILPMLDHLDLQEVQEKIKHHYKIKE